MANSTYYFMGDAVTTCEEEKNCKALDHAYLNEIPQSAIKQLESFYDALQEYTASTNSNDLYDEEMRPFKIINLLFTYDGDLVWDDENGDPCWEAFIEEDGDSYIWDSQNEWDGLLKFWNESLERAKRHCAKEE